MGRRGGARRGVSLFSSKFICFSVAPFIVSFGILSCVCPEVVGAQSRKRKMKSLGVIKMWDPSARQRDADGISEVQTECHGAYRISWRNTGL